MPGPAGNVRLHRVSAPCRCQSLRGCCGRSASGARHRWAEPLGSHVLLSCCLAKPRPTGTFLSATDLLCVQRGRELLFSSSWEPQLCLSFSSWGSGSQHMSASSLQGWTGSWHPVQPLSSPAEHEALQRTLVTNLQMCVVHGQLQLEQCPRSLPPAKQGASYDICR